MGFLYPSQVWAHEGEVHAVTSPVLPFEIRAISWKLILVAFILIALLLFITAMMRKPSEIAKRLVFWALTAVILATTFALIIMTVLVNTNSWSKGPVHWHADLQVWACGTEYELADPEGFSNKVGTIEFHEHNDKRLHFEGVVMQEEDAMLASFFEGIGGSLARSSLTLSTTLGSKTFATGDVCGDSPATLQVFVYKTLPDKTFKQEKLRDPAHYLMSHQSQVPPGDCIIVELDSEKERTDKMCLSYSVGLETGKIKGEVYDEY